MATPIPGSTHTPLLRLKQSVCKALFGLGLGSTVIGPPQWATSEGTNLSDEELCILPPATWRNPIPPPDHAGAQFAQFSQLTYPSAVARRYDRCRIYNAFGDLLPVTRTDTVVNYDRFQETSADLYLTTRLKLPHAVPVSGCFLLLSGAFSRNVFHWYTEVMPLAIAVHALRDRGIEPCLLYSAPAAFHQVSVNWLADLLKVRVFPFRSAIEVEALWVISGLVPVRGAPRPEPIQWLWDELATHLGIDRSRQTRRIFISRSRALRRKLLNEDQLLSRLKGFERCFFEELTPGEQVRMCSEASVIVGGHGAGFSNIVTAGQGCHIVELMGKGYQAACYYHLAGVKDLSYSVFVTETEPAESSANPAADDLVLSARALSEIVDYVQGLS
jgi:capsular polysaccharide biosynthesis protein